ncbi:TetR/AcrR family transcriptional regulator [Sphingomonas abietis]|uniref:TetR/AcrR family transcriptional regulator n=1 Tax=Sphingomonas abietis TaxID=3012344 RepID=A0ABY7NQI0_9SPHN|nr:TetR/AcrR family transcriptional regulator [Sphingomonas abietis]WBO23799.1 TetR/AcrR family transcriptional regulator [Sphingomonas abietis]
MARRGEALREHILWTAKDAFLELGFERTSMDEVSARASTSKRSLYAHFESKERLFLAVIDLVRGLFLGRLKTPADYGDDPVEALTLFCARYLEILLYEPSIQTMRVSMAEIDRFPDGAAQYFDVMFEQVQLLVQTFLQIRFSLQTEPSERAAQQLLADLLHPRLPRALFGIDTLAKNFGEEGLSNDFDLKPVRDAVGRLISSLRA